MRVGDLFSPGVVSIKSASRSKAELNEQTLGKQFEGKKTPFSFHKTRLISHDDHPLFYHENTFDREDFEISPRSLIWKVIINRSGSLGKSLSCVANSINSHFAKTCHFTSQGRRGKNRCRRI